MLEVACAVCGAVYRFSQIDIPVGGKTVTCAKCKSRIVVQPAAPAPPMDGGTGDVIDLGAGRDPSPGPGDPIDLPLPNAEIVDLPTPKLAPPEPGVEIVDLPAPKLVPRDQAEPLTLDNIDLLAPVGPKSAKTPAPSPLLPTEPVTPKQKLAAAASLPDLPAPKRAAEPARPSFSPPPPFASPQAMPGPPRPPAQARPASPPRPPSQPRPPSHPGMPSDLPDLPTPKYPGPARADLFDDLPSRGPSLTDLPTPKRPSSPAPAVPLPPPERPDGGTDLPAPKGFFDDLPRPAPGGGTRGSGPDLPAPKGFFDDLPQPALGGGVNRPDLPAPKGFFDDLPQPAGQQRPDLPAPKGFFDDLPQPAGQQRPDLPAPKGFFDDLPQSAASGGRDLPAPKGFFDDLPQPGYAASGVDLPVPRDFFDDVPQRSRGPSLDLDPSRLPPVGSEAAPPLDLGGEGGDGLSGLDLPEAGPMVPATRTGVVAFRASSDSDGGVIRAPAPPGELDVIGGTVRRDSSQTITTREETKPRLEPRKLKRLIAIIAAVVVVLGAGGYFAYDRWQTKKARAAAMERSLASAHKALVAGDAGHWGRAISSTKEVLSRSPKHAEALATAALAQLAGYYDQGTNKDARVKAGRSLLEQARLASASGPTMVKATALDALVEGDAKAAIDRLTPMVPADAEAVMYLAWAQLAAQRWDEAAATFDKAASSTPGRKAAAIYGRGQALLGKGDLDGARDGFLAVIALDADHVGAQVGLAAATPAGDFLKRENELLAILQRPKLDTVDPRVRALAWRLAGNDARTAGRLDAARERYRKALELAEDDVATLVASAALELRDGKLDVAGTGVERALAAEADDVDANLVKIELEIKNGELDLAAARIKTLRDRQPPIAGVAPRGQLELLDGLRLATAGDFDGALKAYRAAKDVLGGGDIAPTIAIAQLLTRMAADAEKAGKADVAAKLRADATAELSGLAGPAAADPAKAVTLGVAYLEAGGLVEAERWLRTAITARPDDVEGHFQLSEVLRRANRVSEAIDELKQAFTLAPTRIDLGLSLARAYEQAGRDDDAKAAYEKLLEGEDNPDTADKISLDVRARAGRFFARTGDKKRAGKEGAAILAVESDSPAGHFLKGEGFLADAHNEEARREFQRAVDKENDGQFQDGLGRGWEAMFVEKNDTSARDEALRAYIAAVAKEPHPSIKIHALDGAGRMSLHRRDYEEAITYLLAAYKLEPTAERAGNIGRAYAELKRTDEAIQYLQAAARGDASGETFYILGDLYVTKGNRARDVAAMWTRATDEGEKEEHGKPTKLPWLDDAWRKLGEIQDGLGNLNAACRAYKQYLARHPSDPGKVNDTEVKKGAVCR